MIVRSSRLVARQMLSITFVFAETVSSCCADTEPQNLNGLDRDDIACCWALFTNVTGHQRVQDLSFCLKEFEDEVMVFKVDSDAVSALPQRVSARSTCLGIELPV
jgi:hypothetical protein